MGKTLIIKGADFSANAIGVTFYSVVLNTNDSSLGTVSGAGNYERDSTITISANPIGSAHFERWSDNDTNPTRQIKITGNINLTAYFSSVSQGYGIITFNGTENWQFNANNEPNSYGIYNCYVMNPSIINPELAPDNTLKEASCNIAALSRLVPFAETRVQTTIPGFGYKFDDPSFFVRFNSDIATSVETFKEYLAQNNLIVTYKQK